MPIDVPTGEQLKSTAKNGGISGLAAGLGEAVGRGILGPGLGTAAGGIAAASALDGQSQEITATVAVERGFNELMAGGSRTSGSGRGVK